MSIEIMERVWKHSRAKGGDLLTLLAIADNADAESAEAYPGIEYLAGKTRLSARGVKYATKRLIELGELELVERGGFRGGRATANLYRVKVQSLPQAAPYGQFAADEGADISPQPSVEPSVVKKKEENAGWSNEDVQKIWGFYVSLSKARRKEMDTTQRRVIEQALKVATPRECCQAIRALFASDFHQKRGEHAGRSGQKYRSLADALKGRPMKGESTRERIEKWVELDSEPESGDGDFFAGTEFAS